ncbi:MAG TPA: LptF/LptG family permease, partial [Rectinemataceae bacterium]
MHGSRLGRPGWMLRRQLLVSALKRFLGGELFLVGIMVLAELFSSMWKLLAMEAALGDILRWVGAGIPARALDVLPVALLFGVTLSLAELHADGEFLAICSSGIRLQSLSTPLIIFSIALGGFILVSGNGFLASVGRERDRLYASMTGQKSQSRQASNISILARSGTILYRAGYYDPKEERLADVDLVRREAGKGPLVRILAKSARWDGSRWEFRDARIYTRLPGGSWAEERKDLYADPILDE